MIKVFVADDEQIVIDSIKFVIEKSIPNTALVGSARSGREAVEKINEIRPDIVLMDIRMPGISGIEAIKKIKERHSDIIFIIITAYEYFDYAKDAIALGVFDYLLKPLNKNKIIEVIDKATETITRQRKSMAEELELKEALNKILPYLESEFVYSHFYGKIDDGNIEFYESIFDMQLDYGYVMIGNVDYVDSVAGSIDKQVFYDCFATELKSIVPCLVGPPMLNSIAAYVPVERQMSSFEIKNESIEIAKRLCSRLDERVNLNYRIGIGRPYDIENFTVSYDEADRTLKIDEEKISHFDDQGIVFAQKDIYPFNKEKLLIDKVIMGDGIGAVRLFNEIFDWMALNYRGREDKMADMLRELFIVLNRTASYYMEGNMPATYSISGNDDIEEIKTSILAWIKTVSQNIRARKDTVLNEIIRHVEDFIAQNYNKDITMDDVAREVNMSYHYFSKFFKEQTGRNFVEYLSSLRIQKAEELLADPSRSIKDVCYSVGYNDPNYFSKLFKKYTGKSPSEYRASLGGEQI
ncbi:response regulator [Mahella sp.]|uniref:response regulator n=1 Tax=Mahella sp. TaxID=2798721 RepID=UPI0025B81C13|nr:response regulator [Mahella sp.]MBZ4666800.1 two component transcriptional regulator, AraC family [Mahella sp.]